MNILCRLGWHKMKPVAVKIYKSDGQTFADIRLGCKHGCRNIQGKPFETMETPYKYIERVPVEKGEYHLSRNPRRRTA